MEEMITPLLCTIESPPTGVRYHKFEAKVTIEKNAQADNTNDLALVSVEVQTVPGFFVEGPTKRVIAVFVGQKTVIPIRFFPLTAGSLTLPQITLTDTTPGSQVKPKKLLVPIVITYTS
jgi:hypothetical protein